MVPVSAQTVAPPGVSPVAIAQMLAVRPPPEAAMSRSPLPNAGEWFPSGIGIKAEVPKTHGDHFQCQARPARPQHRDFPGAGWRPGGAPPYFGCR